MAPVGYTGAWNFKDLFLLMMSDLYLQ